MPETPEGGAQEMAAWQNWFAKMGEAVVQGGAPAGMNHTVSASGVHVGAGDTPATGYSVVQADDMEAAIDLAKGCPILKHGTVEVAQCMDL